MIYLLLLSISLAAGTVPYIDGIQQLAYSTSPRPRFMLFGDSITQRGIDPNVHGFGTLLANAYSRKVDVINRGLSGYTTKTGLEMLPLIVDEWASHPPDFMTIFFGANDAVLSKPRHVSLEDYVKNLKVIVTKLQQGFPGVKLLLISPPPVNDYLQYPRRLNNVTQHYAQACIKTAAELKLPSIDAWTLFQEEKSWQDMFKDGLHFNTAGNEFMYKILQQHIDRLIPEFARDKILKQYH